MEVKLFDSERKVMEVLWDQGEDLPAREIARRGWAPTFICESAGTQAEDALEMKQIYQNFLLEFR